MVILVGVYMIIPKGAQTERRQPAKQPVILGNEANFEAKHIRNTSLQTDNLIRVDHKEAKDAAKATRPIQSIPVKSNLSSTPPAQTTVEVEPVISNLPILMKMEQEDYPEEINNLILQHKNEEGAWVIDLSGESFILVTMGEKPTTGYDITLTNTQKYGDSIAVSLLFKKPVKGRMTGQSLTYPMIVLKTAENNDIRIRVVGDNNSLLKEYFLYKEFSLDNKITYVIK